MVKQHSYCVVGGPMVQRESEGYIWGIQVGFTIVVSW